MRSCQLCPCGTIGSRALRDLLDAFLRLSLVCQRPAVQDSTECHLVGKTLFLRKADEGFGTLLGGTLLAAELMEHGSSLQGIPQTIGVDNVLRQGHRLLVPCQSLVRIAKMPQRQGGMAAAHHARVLPIKERRGTVLLGIVERYTLCQMRARRGSRAQEEQRRS